MSVTIASAQYWSDWPYPSDSSFEVRAKSSRAWISAELEVVPAGETRVVGTDSITALRLTIPAITLPATSAGLDDQTAKWTVTLHRTGRKEIVDTVLADFPLPVSFEPSTTWAEIKINKNGKQPLRDTSVYTKTETNTQIALAAGELNYAGVDTLGRIETATAPADPLRPKAVETGDPRITGTLVNTRSAKTAAYTLLNTDKQKTIALGGSAFYALTVGAASALDSDFIVLVLNEDTARAKLLAINGLTSFYLYPGQSIILYNQNNAWKVHGRSRWAIPAGTSIFVATTGNDANDGLDAAAPLLNPQTAISRLKSDVDFANVNNGSPVVVKLADGTYSAASSVIYISDAWVGSNTPLLASYPSVDEAPVKIRGNVTTPANVVLNNTASPLGAVLVRAKAWAAMEGVKLTSTNSPDLQVAGSSLFIYTNCILGANGVATGKVYTSHNATVESYGTNWAEGDCVAIYLPDYQSAQYHMGTTTLLGNITADYFGWSSRVSTLDYVVGSTIDLNGFTFTGRKGFVNYGGNIVGATAAAVPGTDPLTSGFSSYEGDSVTNARHIGVKNRLDGNTAGAYVIDADDNLIGFAANFDSAGIIQDPNLPGVLIQLPLASNDGSIKFWTSNANASIGAFPKVTLDKNGNLIMGSAALATTATDGFFYLDSCAGPPTGTPTTVTGRVPAIVDTANSKLYLYIGGAWKSVTLA